MTRLSVLDIGGGDGMLALFLPEVDYVLAEPGTNGIAAEALPFGPRSFDVVLACHVLEHIPAEARTAFLETLCRTARREVVLLNPFRPADSGRDEWLELVLAVTGAPWAREHLACGFPALAEVEAFAAARGLPCRAEPNGLRTLSTLHVLLSHYAGLAKRSHDLPRINELAQRHRPGAPAQPGLADGVAGDAGLHVADGLTAQIRSSWWYDGGRGRPSLLLERRVGGREERAQAILQPGGAVVVCGCGGRADRGLGCGLGDEGALALHVVVQPVRRIPLADRGRSTGVAGACWPRRPAAGGRRRGDARGSDAP